MKQRFEHLVVSVPPATSLEDALREAEAEGYELITLIVLGFHDYKLVFKRPAVLP